MVLNEGVEVRFFGPDGAFLRTVGRRGEGPGEFRYVEQLWAIPGDTILVYDFGLTRLTLLDRSGELIETIHLVGLRGGLYGGRLPDGSHLMHVGSPVTEVELGRGARQRAQQLALFAPDGSSSIDLLTFPIDWFQLVGRGEVPPPFSPTGDVEVVGDQIVTAFSDRYELRYYASDGSLRRIARKTFEPVPIPPEVLDAAIEDAFSSEVAGTVLRPETYPAFEGILSGRAGNVWVEAYRPEGTEGPRRWSVFGPDGVWITDLETPADLHVLEVGSDYVLGIWRDDLGVEYLRLYRIVS